MVKAQKFACFVSIVMLLIIMLSIVLFAMPITSAEEFSSDKYVVFNQLVNNGNFANGTTGFSFNNLSGSVADGIYTCKPTSIPSVDYACLISFSVNYVNSHKYFIRLDCKSSKSNSYFTITNNQGVYLSHSINSIMSTYSGIFTSSKSGTFNTLIYSNFSQYSTSDTFSVSNINIIDLTQMFGAGKEPSIDFCRNLFVSNYYPYISNGSVISLDGFSNYNQGVSDTLNSFSTTLVYSTLRRGAYIYDKLGMTEISDVNFDYSDYKYPELIMAGITAIPFNLVIKANSTVIVESNTFSSTSIRYFNFGYLNNGNIVPLYSFDNYTDYDTVYFTFITPIDIDTIYVYGSNVYMGTPIQQISTLGNISFSFTSFDNSLFLSNSYDTGYDSGYNIGYNSGYNKGYNKGLSIGADKQYSFAGLLDAVVQAPITALIGSYDSSGKRVGGLLNFNFLGVNLSFFFTGLLSVTIVIVIIRFILARK